MALLLLLEIRSWNQVVNWDCCNPPIVFIDCKTIRIFAYSRTRQWRARLGRDAKNMGVWGSRAWRVWDSHAKLNRFWEKKTAIVVFAQPSNAEVVMIGSKQEPMTTLNYFSKCWLQASIPKPSALGVIPWTIFFSRSQTLTLVSKLLVACKRVLHLGESRQVTREQHAKVDPSAKGVYSLVFSRLALLAVNGALAIRLNFQNIQYRVFSV